VEKKKVSLKAPFTEKKQLRVSVETLSQEMYKRNLELAETNQALSLLRAIDALVLKSHDKLEVLCQKISEVIVDNSNYLMVALLANPLHKEYLTLMGWAASNGTINGSEGYRLKLDDYNGWLTGTDATGTIQLDTVSDKQIAQALGILPEEASALRGKLPVKSIVLVKLYSRHRLVGLLAVGFNAQPAEITEKQRMLLERLSEAVGIALDNRLLYEENRRIVLQLQHSNVKLKALDETKDDFISMASHQLRTPLTSVKGYLSMVLEGDAGKINETERKMLSQAYTSSQRMVYLIADLLNVSRLKTGKFIIDSSPTDLSQMIDEELGQLTEAASGRSLTLTYDKPKDFPVLMLDETKTRQVLMNFIDNAIYYTPKDGHIRIELKDTGPTVEFRVIDDGIGVPKSEQHHLFTKFYRAGNARKARPDGTGLGLFMAKKVITAQNGALIFESKEGEGSTFGFTFTKSKLAPPEVKG
jgi:signal transduction histidine kinase